MTIGGLLQERRGHVPRVGEVVHEQDLRLQVESVANHSVNAVSITLPEGMELPDLDEDGG
jgi:CBS domain containing-hemolysin-like protein